MTLLLAYWKACCLAALVAFMHAEIPTPEGEEDYREALAAAIVTASPLDPQEQRQLAMLARYESGYVPRLGAPRCECKPWECDQGRAKGAFQHLSDRCPFSLEADARIALRHVRTSVAALQDLPKEERLSLYCRGRASDEGKRLSRVRYAP